MDETIGELRFKILEQWMTVWASAITMVLAVIAAWIFFFFGDIVLSAITTAIEVMLAIGFLVNLAGLWELKKKYKKQGYKTPR